MVGLFQMCDAFSQHVKFGYDWGGSVTAEAADKNEDRTVYDCCHSLACTVGTGPGQCAIRGRPIRGPVDWSNPKSVAGSMWFPKYKTKVMGAIQAEAQRAGIEYIEMVVINGGPVSQLEKRTMPHIITGSIADLQKKGMDIGLAGQGKAISVFMRPMEYDEFFPRFHHVESAGTTSGGCVDLSDKHLKVGNATALAWFLATSAGAAVEALAVGANPIGTEGGNILIEAIQSSNLKTIDIGKPLPLQGKYESDTVDLADSGMGPGQVVILAWWLTTDAAAGVARLSLGSNPQIGDEAMVQLLEVLKDVSLTSLDISKTGCAVSTTGKLAELLSGATKFSAALTEVDVRRNMLDEAVLEQLRAAAPETCKILAD